MAHGSKSHRLRGSIGASASPSRVFPGLKMAGHMGNERKKIRKLKVVSLSIIPIDGLKMMRIVLSFHSRMVLAVYIYSVE